MIKTQVTPGSKSVCLPHQQKITAKPGSNTFKWQLFWLRSIIFWCFSWSIIFSRCWCSFWSNDGNFFVSTLCSLRRFSSQHGCSSVWLACSCQTCLQTGRDLPTPGKLSLYVFQCNSGNVSLTSTYHQALSHWPSDKWGRKRTTQTEEANGGMWQKTLTAKTGWFASSWLSQFQTS